ncbi:MAG: hypothetical protein BJ554DRAFT_8199 [Olpidium bornovanus]|uniref:UBC core domain-containing protein n=1 Tax=Olpidium bornovanus TaxID=278681 RepID=A0A8H8DJ91_9FUNG|nr:MAG: hypothetical protein BJ554DRAFT_8199 [Olpidium bornovanus]
MAQQSAMILRRQLNELSKNPVPGFTCDLVDDNIYVWDVGIVGAPDTIYAGGYFKVKIPPSPVWRSGSPPRKCRGVLIRSSLSLTQATMTFPDDYPFNPPKFRFNSMFFHPNGMFDLIAFGRSTSKLASRKCVCPSPPPPQPTLLIAAVFYSASRAQVYQDGTLCISILHPPGDDPTSGEKAAERWNPTQSVESTFSPFSLLREVKEEGGKGGGRERGGVRGHQKNIESAAVRFFPAYTRPHLRVWCARGAGDQNQFAGAVPKRPGQVQRDNKRDLRLWTNLCKLIAAVRTNRGGRGIEKKHTPGIQHAPQE